MKSLFFTAAIAAMSIALLAAVCLPHSALAQTVTVGAPTIACDTPSGVGCNGKTVLQPGKYRVLSTHNLSGKGSCQVSGPGGSGYVLCSALRKSR
jgi:hypothetical protein